MRTGADTDAVRVLLPPVLPAGAGPDVADGGCRVGRQRAAHSRHLPRRAHKVQRLWRLCRMAQGARPAAVSPALRHSLGVVNPLQG
jgi:hypothetical protein